MYGTILKGKRTYDNDINLEYYDTDFDLCTDYVWLFEHSNEVIELIKMSKNQADMRITLKDRFELSDYQIRKISQIRLDMLTQEKYEECKSKIREINDWREKKEFVDIHTYQGDRYDSYKRKQIAKLKLRKEELDAYFIAADNYLEIIKLMEDNEEFHQFTKAMWEKFGFSINQCNYFKHMTIQEFSKKEREKKQSELEHVKEELQIYEKEWIWQ